MDKKISVIIPTYNTEKYIKGCVESVLNQTYQNFEIIVVNDGSTDNTLEILSSINSDKLKVITIENSGQGYARNMALKQATGEYILFLDSDDYIEPYTLELTLKRIEEDESDYVYFDYKYLNVKTNKFRYNTKESFLKEKTLEGKDCLKALSVQHYFTVNKLYRKSFLVDNEIKYGEKYIYEDVVFWVRVATKSKKVSIIHSPLYVVRTNETSTTRTGHNTDRHVNGFLRAFDESIELIKDEKSKYMFLSYMLSKFLIYYSIRTPRKLKKNFLNQVYSRFKDYDIKNLNKSDELIKYGVIIKALKNKMRFKFYAATSYSLLRVYRFYRQSLVRIINKILEGPKKKLKDTILFMGFDYRYTGSSRYLFEKMLANGTKNMYFVTDNEMVPKKMRLKLNSLKLYRILRSSKVVIFESWISKRFVKPKGAIWINLWHGTPLKKMLFDSNEKEIMTVNPRYKRDKFNSIQKMDYLLVDNPNISKYFETSFLMSKEQILGFGYPRVEYLINNKENEELKASIREKLNIGSDKKIIMYLPTWRDYNYKDAETYDFNYLLDKDALEKALDDEKYVIVSKDHAFLRKAENVTVTDIETQELLLVSDFVVTDYSSVMFDAIAIDIPVGIIAKDYDKYSLSRGVYEDMWSDLKSFVVNDEKALAELIKNYKLDDKYEYVKETYCYKSNGDLIEFINNKV